jgi:hypothetical protein
VNAFPLGMFFLLLIWLLSPPAAAQHTHHPGPGAGEEKKAQASADPETSTARAFLLEGNIKAVFSITPMAEHKKMLLGMKMKVEVDPQATHNIAVTLTDTRDNQPVLNAVVKMKVISPKGKDQIKILDAIPAMNQYGQDFSLTEKGRYQVLILFRNGGKKTGAGFYYRLR